MKHIIPALLLLFVIVFAMSCANQSSPTGGPKDTIPPTLLHSVPAHKSINYKSQEFTLTFDERVSADRIKQHLIITPYIDNPYKFRVKKNVVFLTFENPFEDTTTYTLNFADGIGDITENNIPDNLKIAFSTGPTIDSMSINGSIRDIYTNANIKQALVSLYAETDTVDAFTGKPRYFAKTDEKGFYQIENIKNGQYKVYAIEDKNNNMKIDASDELHGFKSGYISLTEKIDSLHIPVILVDSRELLFSRGKNTGLYYDVLYNKYLKRYDIKKLDSTKSLSLPHTNLVSENRTIRFYRPEGFPYETDSLGITIQAFDSLDNARTDTLYIMFKESKRKPETFEYQVAPESTKRQKDTLNLSITFNKPITQVNLDSIYLGYDTLQYQFLSDDIFEWNETMTKFKATIPLDESLLPHLMDSLLMNYQDTTETDSIYLYQKAYLEQIDSALFSINIANASFISVENDTVESITRNYVFKDNTETGVVSGNITTDYESFTLQITDPKYKVIQSIRDVKAYKFSNLKPGKYTYRVLIDNNNDSIWSYGNIQQDIEAESVYFYPEVFDVRANWELENVDIQF